MVFDPLHLTAVLDQSRMPVELEALPERRDVSRRRVRWPVLLFRDNGGEVIEGVTEDLSCKGFFCFSEMALACGELLTCILRIPMGRVGSDGHGTTLRCSVRVLHVGRSSLQAPFGIGCRIENYSVSDARVPMLQAEGDAAEPRRWRAGA